MKAIIFAAGMAKRLGDLTKETPKCCLPLFEEETLLDRSLKNISRAGFNHVIIVTGHADNKIEELLSKNWKNKFNSIETIFNEDYATKNNIYSAHVIKDLIDNDTFIFNSDIVYDYRILENAVKRFKEDSSTTSFLVVDDKKKLLDEDMKVKLNPEGKIIRIHKEQNNDECVGEYIGILHLEDPDISYFDQSINEMIKAGKVDEYYEDALDKVLDKLNLGIVSTEGLSWAEMDTPEDYERAKSLECVKSQYQTI